MAYPFQCPDYREECQQGQRFQELQHWGAEIDAIKSHMSKDVH